MRRELVIAAGPGEWRAALVEDGSAVELYVERGERAEIGSVHLGRVRHLVPALGAALVDIGGERLAYLPFGEALPAGARPEEGARVIVQVRREAQGGKAARLTMRALLPGERLELRLGRPGIEAGSEAGERLLPADRARLLAAIEHGPPPPAASLSHGRGKGAEPLAIGLKIRESAPTDILAAEAAALSGRWHDIGDRAGSLRPPCRLFPLQSFAGALAAALAVPPHAVFVDDHAALPQIRAAFTGAEIAYRPEGECPIDLDGEFDRALARSVALHQGTVHIEATRAAVLIDVDSGMPEGGSPERTALAASLAAAEVIAHEIRRRNLGGGIVVDFIGLGSRAPGIRAGRERVRSALAGALAADPARPQILGWTRLGHLELVRPRRGRPLAEALLEPRPGGAFIKTALTVAHEALRALARADRAEPGRQWHLLVAPEVAAALEGSAAGALRGMQQRLRRPIAIEAEPARERERFEIVAH